MPRSTTSSTARGYGAAYRAARAELLKDDPPCHWCGAPATTADHDPPIHVVGRPHLDLVPACEPCNLGRKSGPPRRAVANPSRDW